MLGQFHISSRVPALHSSSFFPLRTPYPSLAIRHMVPSDLPFLLHDAGFLKSYLNVFKDDQSASAKINIAKAEEALRSLC